ncbi:hypothetical protein G3480_17560 [Thiorhodococcus mannitoliphagus]|uniref:UPF0225 protein G3480_17560 n=1 Tax=Thiorhodococcus mannitoliphagus TaxID=329406 RepID=A0A6P1DYD1_9GAMM|nr:YchJ family metal-binding protein [Thiorhodococcus mannitoliphagus]NEX22093.1 hypothetical protein [Thiorhodococcus mannitoliphagus]
MSTTPCPCGSGSGYASCCGRFIEGDELPETAEALMRSRYVAYAMSRTHYLRATWHASTRPADLSPDASIRWIGLKILETEAGGPGDAEGWVAFVARYKLHGRAHRMHERSHFLHEQGRWRYVSGEVTSS